MTRTTFYTWQEARTSLSREWRELVRERGFNPSLDPAWVDAALRSHDRCGDAMVAASWRGSRLVGVLPLLCSRERVHGLPLRTVDLASNVVAYHPEIVASNDTGQLLSDALAHAHGGRWDLFRATNVPEHGATRDVLETASREFRRSTFITPGECSPYIKIDRGWEEFLRIRSKKLRANLLRTARHSDDFGAVSTRWYLEAGDEASLLSDILRVEQFSWKARAGSAITNRPTETNYHRLLLPVLSELRALFANVLHVNGMPTAYVLCCRYGDWVGQLKTSYNSDFKDAGARVINDSVQRAFVARAGTYDFLGDAAPHKMKWTELSRCHHSYWVYSSRPLAVALSAARHASLAIKRTVAAMRRQADLDMSKSSGDPGT